MRFLKPIVSYYMALLIGITSLGISVSAHACSETGFSETSLGHLKACCKMADGHGFRAEPCCKLSVKYVKLATVRSAHVALSLPMASPAILVFAPHIDFALQAQCSPQNPSESPPILPSIDVLSLHCKLLI